MGWNAVTPRNAAHPLFAGIDAGSEFYFVHSYYPAPSDEESVLAETDYAGVRFASVVGRDNLVATQFHPEKSGRVGLRLLQNFINWNGRP
jgi:glutamine amidotransferase